MKTPGSSLIRLHSYKSVTHHKSIRTQSLPQCNLHMMVCALTVVPISKLLVLGYQKLLKNMTVDYLDWCVMKIDLLAKLVDRSCDSGLSGLVSRTTVW